MTAILSFLKKQLMSKTNWIVILSILFYVLKHFGLVEDAPDGYGLGATTAAVIAVVIKVFKTLFYKLRKPISTVV